MPPPAVDGDEAAANAAALAMGAARAGSAPAVPLADRIETLYDTVYKFQTRLDELTAESTTFGLDYKSITVGDGQLCRWWRLLVTAVAQVLPFYSLPSGSTPSPPQQSEDATPVVQCTDKVGSLWAQIRRSRPRRCRKIAPATDTSIFLHTIIAASPSPQTT